MKKGRVKEPETLDRWLAGQQLRNLRRKAGVPMTHLAHAMGLHKSMLSLLENGQRGWTTRNYLLFFQKLEELAHKQ